VRALGRHLLTGVIERLLLRGQLNLIPCKGNKITKHIRTTQIAHSAQKRQKHTFSLGQESVETKDQLVVPAEQVLNAFDDTGGINPIVNANEYRPFVRDGAVGRSARVANTIWVTSDGITARCMVEPLTIEP
jgi:hypothetical protein